MDRQDVEVLGDFIFWLHLIVYTAQTATVLCDNLRLFQGTQIYDAKKGSFVDLGVLDVMQIFGRAGRPQYDTLGHGTIVTTHDKLAHYLSLLTQQNPIESQFVNSLTDNLNAEVTFTVSLCACITTHLLAVSLTIWMLRLHLQCHCVRAVRHIYSQEIQILLEQRL